MKKKRKRKGKGKEISPLGLVYNEWNEIIGKLGDIFYSIF
jgi:hypothetical protein